MARRTWSSLFKSLFGASTTTTTRNRRRPNLHLERMEERANPATATLSSGVLTIDYTFTGTTTEAVTMINNGTNLVLSGDITGTTSFTASGVSAISIGASGNSTAQSFTLGGTNAYTLAGTGTPKSAFAIGNGVEQFNLNQSIKSSGGSILVALGTKTVLGANVSLDATNAGGTSAGADIKFADKLDGAFNLTMSAGTGGDVALDATGSVTPLGAVLVNSADYFSISGSGSFKGTSLKQLAGTNDSTLSGNVTTTGAAGVDITSKNVYYDATIDTTTGNGVVRLIATTLLGGDNSGVAETIVSGGVVTLTAGTEIDLNGNISTTGDTVNIFGPVKLYEATTGVTIDTTSGGNTAGGLIQFTKTIMAPGGVAKNTYDLTLNAGTGGDIDFVDAMGVLFDSTVSPRNLVIVNARDVTANALIAALTITQTAGTGTTQFNGGLNAITSSSSVNTLDITTKAITANGDIDAYRTALNATGGALTVAAGKNITADRGIQLTSATGISVGGSINAGDSIAFHGPVTLTGAVVIDSYFNTAVSTAHDITFDSTVNGAFDLTLKAPGTGSNPRGNVLFTGALGGTTPLGNVLVTNAANVTVSQSFKGASLQQTTGSGTTTLNGSVIATGANGVQMVNANFAANAPITSSAMVSIQGNSGTMTIAAAGDIVAGDYVDIVGSAGISTAGDITSNTNSGSSNGVVQLYNPVTLTGSILIDTTGKGANTGADLILNKANNATLNGSQAGKENLTITAGTTGSALFYTKVGSNIPLGAVVINSAKNVLVDNAFSAASLAQTTGSGTTTINGAITTNNSSGVNFSNSIVSLYSSITTSNAGTVTLIAQSGALTLASGSSIVADGTVSLTGSNANGISASGSVTTQGDVVSFNSAVTLGANVVVDTTSGAAAGANISFANVINGAKDLTLKAGTGGNVTLSKTVGSITRLGNVIVSSAKDVSFAGKVTAASLTQTTGSGTTTMAGDIDTNGASGVNITNNAVTLSGGINTSNGGTVTLNSQSGVLTLSSGSLIGADGAVSLTGSKGISASGSVTTQGDAVSFNSAVTLDGNVAVDTTSNAPAGANISFSGTINGGKNLSLNAGTGGTISITGDTGKTVPVADFLVVNAKDVTVSSKYFKIANLQVTAVGTTQFSGDIYTTGTNDVIITSGVVTLTGSISPTKLGTGGGIRLTAQTGSLSLPPVMYADKAVVLSASSGINASQSSTVIATTGASVSFASKLTIGSQTYLYIDTTTSSPGKSSPGADISFSGTVDGGTDLDLYGGVGSITFSNAVGGTTRVGKVTVNSAKDVSFAAVTAASLTQTTGTGTTTMGGAINTNGASGVNMTNNAVTLGGGITTSNAGTVTLNSQSGVLTLSGGSSIVADGAVSLTGSNGISASGSVTTTGKEVSFNSAVTLGGNVVVDTTSGSATGANISFSGTIDGGKDLSLNAGTGGTVGITNAVGGTTRVGNVTVSSAKDVSFAAVTATSLAQTTGSGTTTLNGAVNTTGAGGVQMVNANFAVNAPITSSAMVSIHGNSGTMTIAAAGDILAGDYVDVVGSAGIFTAGDITSNINSGSSYGVVQLYNPVTLTGSILIDTTGKGANTGASLIFNDSNNATLDGSKAGKENLTITAGTTGSVLFNTKVGANIPLGAVVINNAGDVLVDDAFFVASLAQTTGSGTTTTNGAITTNTAAGIQLANKSIALNQTIDTVSGGGVVNLNATLNDVDVSGNISAGGAVNLTAANAIFQYSSDIATTGGAVTYHSNLILNGTMSAKTNLAPAAGANITFLGTVNNRGRFTLTSGTGNILFSDAVGSNTSIRSLTIDAANDVTFSKTCRVSEPLLITATGTTILNGLTNTGDVTTVSSGVIQVLGPIDNYDALTLKANSGKLTISSVGDIICLRNVDLTASGGIETAGDITTDGDRQYQQGVVTFHSPTILTGPVVIDTTNSLSFPGEDISFLGTLNGTQNLTITAWATGNTTDSGNVLFAGAVGGTTPLGDVLVNDAKNLMVAGSFKAASLNQTTGNGTTTIADALFASGTKGVVINNQSVTVSKVGSVSSSSNGISLAATVGDLLLDGPVSASTAALILNSAGKVKGTGLLTGGTVTATGTVGIGDAGALKLATSGLITLNSGGDATVTNTGASLIAGTVTGLMDVTALTGGITDGGALSASTIALTAPGASGIAQALTGSTALRFGGTGTLTLAGANTNTGNTTVNAGTVVLTGSLAKSHVTVNGGVFRGNGDVAALNANKAGTIRPGRSPGKFASAGPMAIDAGGNYEVEIDGVTPVSGYSQVDAGTVSLTGKLSLVTANNFRPDIGTRFTIINNTGANPVAGTFGGLAEGGTVFMGQQKFRITYQGNDGNDVVIQAINDVVPPTPVGPAVTTPFIVDPGSIIPSVAGTVKLTMSSGVYKTFVAFRGYNGLTSVNAVDRDGDGISDALITAKASGGYVGTVTLIDANTGRAAYSLTPFGTAFTGGVRVTSGIGRINGVLMSLFAVASGPGIAPTVKIYNAVNGAFIKQITPFASSYRGGVELAMSNPDRNGKTILVVTALSTSEVKVYDISNTARPLNTFKAFTQPMSTLSLRVGDVNGDGLNEIVTGVGRGLAPTVRVFSDAGVKLKEFLAFERGYTGGVNLGISDFDHDGALDIVVGTANSAKAKVAVFKYANITTATPVPQYTNSLSSAITILTIGSDLSVR